MRRPPHSDHDIVEDDLTVSGEEHHAAGMKAVMVSLRRGVEQMGVVRTTQVLTKLNQRNGFDCPGRPITSRSTGMPPMS